MQFDVIVIGSGITGGWAAKELAERGLTVALVERGRKIEHQTDYTTELKSPWELPFRGNGDLELFKRDYPVQMQGRGFDEWTYKHFVNDREHPYETTETEGVSWRRAYQLGGRSLVWGRQCYRWGPQDFKANAEDGNGCDWPVRYEDLATWYDHVEEFIGVNGAHDGLTQLPDGKFQPPMALNAVEKAFQGAIAAHFSDRCLIQGRAANLTEEKEGRAKCQYRNICARGCSYGAYFSTQSSTLPAAQKTGRLTLLTDNVVETIEFDPRTRRASGVKVVDTKSRERREITARLIFLCAGSWNSTATLMRSTSEAFPNGLANSSGILGHYIMDHANAISAAAVVPGFDEHYYFGNRPVNFLIPRFRNLDGAKAEFLRGYTFQGLAVRQTWGRGGHEAGIGFDLKKKLEKPGPWVLAMNVFAECLPRNENRITLSKSAVDKDGLPQLNIALRYGDNEKALLRDAQIEARAMINLMNGKFFMSSSDVSAGGSSVHEMGGARMGRDPRDSVLNGFNQAHDVPNLFVTDGAAMASSASQNPSLTYMAFTARAAANAVSMLKEGKL